MIKLNKSIYDTYNCTGCYSRSRGRTEVEENKINKLIEAKYPKIPHRYLFSGCSYCFSDFVMNLFLDGYDLNNLFEKTDVYNCKHNNKACTIPNILNYLNKKWEIE